MLIKNLEDLQKIKKDYQKMLGKYKYQGVYMRWNRLRFRELRGGGGKP